MLEKPIRDRRAERREATRAEILDAAWELVRAEGLAGLSLRDLARRVGMQAPSLYSYFESKHAIYDAMFAQGARDYLEREAVVPSTGDPVADLQAGLRFFVAFCTEDPVRYQLMFQRTIPGFEPSPESFAISIEGLERLKARLAGMGLTDQRSLDLLTAIGTGITDQQISNDPGGDRWTRLVDEAVEMYFHHVTNAPVLQGRTRT
jgi:AcrR family transcriptional regulator